MYNYFKLAGYAPELTDQLKREGDIKVTDHLKRVEWIIEAKGLAPAGSNSTDFQTGLGQILMSHYRSDPQIIHALAIPYDGSFPTELVTRIEDKDRACLRLHWIWVKQVPASHGTSYEVKIECPLDRRASAKNGSGPSLSGARVHLQVSEVQTCKQKHERGPHFLIVEMLSYHLDLS